MSDFYMFVASCLLCVAGFMARKSNKTDSGYVVPYWIELYFAKDIPFTRESLMTCIKEFCRVTDEVTDGD